MRKSSEKFYVDIFVQNVVLKKTLGSLEKDASLSVAVERGKHLIASGEKEPTLMPNGDSLIEFNEKLSLEATLYSDGKGRYLEKTGKLILRQKKRGLVSSSFSTIGAITLALHDLVYENDTVERSVLLENCRYPGSQIVLAISFRSADGSSGDLGTQRKLSAAQMPAPTSMHSLTHVSI